MTDYPDNPTEARKVVEQFLDQIDEETEWDVIDYDPYLDVYDGIDVQLKAEFNPETEEFDADVIEPGSERAKTRTLKEIVSDLESDKEDGAPIDLVLKLASKELEISEEAADKHLDELRSQGEIYEPTTKHLRTT